MRCGLFLFLFLAGCDSVASDGYRYERGEAGPVRKIVIVEHGSLVELRSAAPGAAAVEGRELMAWSLLNGERCEVHVVDPVVKYMPEWIGHEIVHCLKGRWHS